MTSIISIAVILTESASACATSAKPTRRISASPTSAAKVPIAPASPTEMIPARYGYQRVHVMLKREGWA